MQENAMLGKWILLAKRVSSERLTVLSDLVEVLASPRKSEWYIKLSKFLRKESCKVYVTREDRLLYREENENGKLGRLVRTIGKLPGGILRALCQLTVNLSSEEGGVWYRELVSFLDGRQCWVYDSHEVVYLRHLFDLRGIGYVLAVYELVRRGNFRQIFDSLRDGRLDKICIPSLKAVTAQCRQFSSRLSSIKGNQIVFFPFTDDEGDTIERYVAYADFSWTSGGDFGIVKRPLEGSDSVVWEPMNGRTPSNKRVFVVLDLS